MDYEGWLAFRAGEYYKPISKLPCVCCGLMVTEAGSAPGKFGDVSCEGIEIGTVCLRPDCMDDFGLK